MLNQTQGPRLLEYTSVFILKLKTASLYLMQNVTLHFWCFLPYKHRKLRFLQIIEVAIIEKHQRNLTKISLDLLQFQARLN